MNSESLLYLWERRSLFIGSISIPIKIRPGAACMIIGLCSPILYRARPANEFRETQCVLTPPGCDFEIDTRGEVIAIFMLDPFGEDYSMLRSQTSESEIDDNGVRFHSYHTSAYQAVCREIYAQATPYVKAYEMLDKALMTGVDPEHPAHPVDPRVVAVVDELQRSVSKNLSIEDLAAVAHVSVSRLIQLFKQQTGIPIRRYRCWHRLFVASVMMAKTGSLTKASVTAGFTDASHFTKTFHSMAGMCPSRLMSGPKRVRLIIE